MVDFFDEAVEVLKGLQLGVQVCSLLDRLDQLYSKISIIVYTSWYTSDGDWPGVTWGWSFNDIVDQFRILQRSLPQRQAALLLFWKDQSRMT